MPNTIEKFCKRCNQSKGWLPNHHPLVRRKLCEMCLYIKQSNFNTSVVKRCTKCKIALPKEAFSINKSRSDGYAGTCKKCHAEEQKLYATTSPRTTYYAANKEKIQAAIDKRKIKIRLYVWNYLLAHPCLHCGESDPTVLDFDHIDPTTKVCNVSTLVYRKTKLETLQAEIDKCQVLCANCHRRKTAKDKNWYSNIADLI